MSLVIKHRHLHWITKTNWRRSATVEPALCRPRAWPKGQIRLSRALNKQVAWKVYPIILDFLAIFGVFLTPKVEFSKLVRFVSTSLVKSQIIVFGNDVTSLGLGWKFSVLGALSGSLGMASVSVSVRLTASMLMFGCHMNQLRNFQQSKSVTKYNSVVLFQEIIAS